MSMKRLIVSLIIFALLPFIGLKAQYPLLPNSGPAINNKADSAKVSLITCSPGTEIYNLFGHTAIRYQNASKNIDVVFNYGMFDFRKPHFVFRFVLGQTDYELGVEDYKEFTENYAFHNRSVEE